MYEIPTKWSTAPKGKAMQRIAVLLLLLLYPLASEAMETVRLQLKWQHQFQFAGYYAAQAQGYYKAVGLDVDIVPAQFDEDAVQQVLQGEAEFGVGTTDLLLLREQGQPVVVLATIFQHSPLALMTLKQDGIQSVHDLAGQKVMIEPGAAELYAYLRKEGVSPDTFALLPHSLHTEDLRSGRADAMSVYVTDEPFELKAAGQAYLLYSPRSVGIDFYGDNLFTTEQQLKQNPEKVRAFREASLKGWAYAMANPEEMVQLIYTQYSQRHGIEHLRFEADQMASLLRASLVEIGHMNPGRWQHIAETYAELGLMKPDFDLKGFLYDPNPPPPDLFWVSVFIGLASLAVICILAVAVFIYRANVHLHRECEGRKKAEEDARRREAFLERIFDILPIGLWFADKDGRLLRGNPAGVRIWGAEPHVPMSEYGVFQAWRLPSREPIAPEDWALAKTVREGVTIVDELLEIQAFDGKLKTVLNYTAPVLDEQGDIEGAIIVNLDISDRIALETRLAQAQKMESVGRLAGGVAHNFNNLLTGILNYVELCRDKLPPKHPVRAFLDEITRDAERSAELTHLLLAFSSKQTIVPKVLDLNDTVAGTLTLLRRLIGENIAVAWAPDNELWSVKLDPSQVNRILTNLCTNARDASAGKVVVATANVTIGQDFHARYMDAAPGEYVLLAVRDDGCGMDSQTLDRLFEPFFTTKDFSAGAGLGLASVHGIVRQNNGFIDVDSEPGKGTTFNIYFPRVAAAPAKPAVVDTPAQSQIGQSTVLVVDDERSVRITTGMLLEHLGYCVLLAESAEEALRVAADHSGPIRLLLTDVLMPGTNGRQLAEKLRATRPDAKCVFMSGYAADELILQGVLDHGVNFLSKPFGRDALAHKVREVLDG